MRSITRWPTWCWISSYRLPPVAETVGARGAAGNAAVGNAAAVEVAAAGGAASHLLKKQTKK